MNYDLKKHPSSGSLIALSRGRGYYKKRKRRQRRRNLFIIMLTTIALSFMVITILNVIKTFGPKQENNISVETPSNDNLVVKDDQAKWDQSEQQGQTDQTGQSNQPDQTEPPDQTEQSDQTDQTKQPDQTEQSGQTEQTDQTKQPDQSDQPVEEGNTGEYDYSTPVPMSEAVDTSYFDDAVFIGDSRTEGLILFTGLTNATAYTHKGLMVDTVFTNPVVTMGGKKISVMEALKKTSFSKIYIMFGINETGWPYNNLFIQKYGEIIDEIKDINPEAIIYVQSILPVTQEVSSTHSYVKNSKINQYNLLLQQMAEEKEIYYINSAESVATSGGYLPEDAAADGIHLKKTYCEQWLDYLKTHTVNAQ